MVENYSQWAVNILSRGVQDGILRKTDEGYVITEYGRTQLAHRLTTDPHYVRLLLLGLICLPTDSPQVRKLAVTLGKRYLDSVHIDGDLEDLIVPDWRERMIKMAAENDSVASVILELVAPIVLDKEEALQIGRIMADILVTE